MPDEPVVLEVRDGVARLTLNRPDAANAIDLALARALADATRRVAADTGVRAVLLSGAGARFCGGGDVRAFAAADDLAACLEPIVGALHEALESLAAIDVPIVAAVQGSAAGAGLALVAASDIVVAGESTKFVMAYTGIGVTPDGGSTWHLARAVGPRRALDLTLTNRSLSAAEAMGWGLVSRVVPDAELVGAADELVRGLAAGPTRAFVEAKRLIGVSESRDLKAQLADEAATLVDAGGSADAKEGITAFVEKRAPVFRGE
jgi:2-(1,2-epoxy-1,2-dihydrophenyl)acetyl-CoA isomerase